MEFIRCYTVVGVGNIIGEVISRSGDNGDIELSNPLLMGLSQDKLTCLLALFLIMPENEKVLINENHIVLSYIPNKELKEGYLREVSAIKAAKSGIITPAQAKISNITDFKRK